MGFFSSLGLNWSEKWIASKTKEAAEQGDDVAQEFLGGMYFRGTFVQQDYKTAVYWYIKAAEQGNVDALRQLGHICTQGEGMPQDYAKAAYMFWKAAESGDAASLSLLKQAEKDHIEEIAQFAEWLKEKLPKLTPEQKAARSAEVGEMMKALNQKRHEKD